MSEENKQKKARELELWELIRTATGAERADYLDELSHFSYHRNDYAECVQMCNTAIDIYNGLGTDLYKKELLHLYGGMVLSMRQLDRYTEAAEICDTRTTLLADGDPKKYCDSLRKAGGNYFAANDYVNSISRNIQALAHPDPDRTFNELGIDNHNIGMCLQRLERYAEAIPYFLAARDNYRKDKDPDHMYFSDELLSLCYIELRNAIEAQHHAQLALNYAITARNPVQESRARFRLGCALVIAEDFEKAESNLQQALELATSADCKDWELIIKSEKEIANILVIKGRPHEAQEIFDRIKSIEDTYNGVEEVV